MEKFEHEGKKYWETFGKSTELLPRQYFDFVSAERYKELLAKYDLQNKKIIDLGAGYPSPRKESPEKKSLPLASELDEILERKGAKIIAVDIAKEPLKYQKEKSRESVLGSAFQLPFKNESVDGGAVILNLFNSSFKGEGRKEIFITPEECKKVLEEVYRVLQKDKFAIVSNYGYILGKMDDLVKFMGPEEEEIITSKTIQELAKEIGFKKVKTIPLDEEREELGKKLIPESFPEALRDRISIEVKEAGALFIEK